MSFLWWIFKQNSYCPEVTYAVGWKLDKELTPFIEAYNLLHITVISVSVTYQYACMPLEPTYRGDFKEIVKMDDETTNAAVVCLWLHIRVYTGWSEWVTFLPAWGLHSKSQVCPTPPSKEVSPFAPASWTLRLHIISPLLYSLNGVVISFSVCYARAASLWNSVGGCKRVNGLPVQGSGEMTQTKRGRRSP